MKCSLATFACLVFCLVAQGQEADADRRPRLLLDGQVGTQGSLGYKFPSSGFGPSVEIPVGGRFEVQAGALYSPDRKAITDDGESLKISGSVIRFTNERWAALAGLERSWLWTSQFNKSSWFPSAGVVIRNDYFGPGRTYVTYVFPTGCVWATPANPCRIQSNRLQGLKVFQDVRSSHHMRWGFESGLYRFCDQANPNEPQLGRSCHWGATAFATMRFEFHVGSTRRAGTADNF